uniref:DnaT-like ssDNA-binding domain-containing protein n=1 Tax=Marinobacterium profundum TaxID=1714300 RepID=UPI0008355FC8|nr:DnaT-like ssDNA-binding domain-containing protein [Marinobacterium profundum]
MGYRFPEQPILFYPSLARRIGSDEALLLSIYHDRARNGGRAEPSELVLSRAHWLKIADFWDEDYLRSVTESLVRQGCIRASVGNALVRLSLEPQDVSTSRAEVLPEAEEAAMAAPLMAEPVAASTSTHSATAAPLADSFNTADRVDEDSVHDGLFEESVPLPGLDADTAAQYMPGSQPARHSASSPRWDGAARAIEPHRQPVIEQRREQGREQTAAPYADPYPEPSRQVPPGPQADALSRLDVHDTPPRPLTRQALRATPQTIQARGPAPTFGGASGWRRHKDELQVLFEQHEERNQQLKPMQLGWQPSETFFALLPRHNITVEYAEGLLDEFVLYWLDKDRKETNWDQKFLAWVKREWVRKQTRDGRDSGADKERQTGFKNENTRRDTREKRKQVTAAIMDIRDTDW